MAARAFERGADDGRAGVLGCAVASQTRPPPQSKKCADGKDAGQLPSQCCGLGRCDRDTPDGAVARLGQEGRVADGAPEPGSGLAAR